MGEGFKIKGTITYIGNCQKIERPNRTSFNKILLGLRTDDGQVLYPEVKNNKIKYLEVNQIVEGSRVEVEVRFTGSEKNGKRYNNINVSKITKL